MPPKDYPRPFAGLHVYYFGSVRGTYAIDLELPWELVQFMIDGGANVPSKRVSEDRAPAPEIFDSPTPWFGTRLADIEGIDRATHLISLVTGPNHGVAMEIQRALDNGMPILCLIREGLFIRDELPWMIRGIRSPKFRLKTYRGLEDAKRTVYDFLTS